MPNNLQRIFDEVKTSVTNSARARNTADVANVTGSVLQFIVDKFDNAWPDWLMTSSTFTQTTQTKNLGGTTFTTPLYAQRVKKIWILDIGKIEGPYDVDGFDPMLSTYPTGVPGYWGWESWQSIQFDYIPNGYTLQIRYQKEVGFIDSQSPPTLQPDIPGFDGFNLLLEGVIASLKLDTTAVDALEQNALWMQKWNLFYDRHAIEDSAEIEVVYR